MSATHSQQSSDLTDEQRAARKWWADLCRNRPAHFAALVRYCDTLIEMGWERDEAYEYAQAAYVAGPVDRSVSTDT